MDVQQDEWSHRKHYPARPSVSVSLHKFSTANHHQTIHEHAVSRQRVTS